jgi:hypothetical protein
VALGALVLLVRGDATAAFNCDRNSSTPVARSTCTPRLAALAARSTGRMSPSSRPVAGSRYRYAVPNRAEPSDWDSAPIEAKPWFCTSTTTSLTPSCTAVTNSCAIIR